MLQLGVIIASVREGRVGLPLAEWFFETARVHGRFEPRLIDLKEARLPLLEEPKHPSLQRVEHATTRHGARSCQWTRFADRDAREYNYGTPPALLNALDHLYVDWNYKTAGFVSYGGISGGTRSVQMTKQVLTTLKMVPMVEAVTVPFVAQFIEGSRFKATDAHNHAATAMLNEQFKWAEALFPLRA